MKVARSRLLRNVAGTLGLLAAVAAVGLGLPAADRALPASRPVAAAPYLVGAGVTVVPPPGAVLDVTATRPGADRGTALFLVGGVRFVVVVSPFSGDVEAAAGRLRAKITGVRGYEVAGAESVTATATGLAGRQGGYAAPGRLGRYAVFRAAELAIEVTVAGTDPQLRATLAAVEASTRSIAFRGAAP
jgi:hypothetical protein